MPHLADDYGDWKLSDSNKQKKKNANGKGMNIVANLVLFFSRHKGLSKKRDFERGRIYDDVIVNKQQSKIILRQPERRAVSRMVEEKETKDRQQRGSIAIFFKT
jgi:hypothetical protein